MRFYLDHDVPAQVCSEVLTPAGHECWTASNAGMSGDDDDEQTVYATDRLAKVVSCDAEFSNRRGRNAIGGHVYLKCPKPEAVDILSMYLDEVVALLSSKPDVTVTVTRTKVSASYRWG